ncbi:hypothetical protein Aperf_G00000049379 [Anoplocephala perfoliata]
MRGSTVILFSLLIILLTLSSTEGFSLFKHSKKTKKTSTKGSVQGESINENFNLVKHKDDKGESSLRTPSKNIESIGSEEDLLSLYNVQDKYRKYYEGSEHKAAPIKLSGPPSGGSAKTFDTSKARSSAEHHIEYLKSIGGGTGADRTKEQQLAYKRVHSRRKYN